MLTASQILRADTWSDLLLHACFAIFFSAAISSYMVLISSASFSSHSSRVLAYTFLEMRLPLTLGVNRPSYRWSFIMVTHPVPLLRIFPLYGSNFGSVGAFGVGCSLALGAVGSGISAFVPPIFRSMRTAACCCMVSVMWLYRFSSPS